MAKQIRFISQPAIIDGQDVAEVAAFDVTGHPLTVGSAPAAGSVTNGMLAGGITKDKLAEGVIPPRLFTSRRQRKRAGRREEGRDRGRSRFRRCQPRCG